MRYENNGVRDLSIAYIGGGSRGWAWTFMTDLAMDGQLGGTISLYDIDREAAEHNRVIGNALTARKDTVGKWNYKTADSLKEALTGADFVVISILPGTFEEMRSDVHAPEKFGIYQSVGDTVGPGGFLRAMRTIPMYVEIARAIRENSPNAWVINYTNPMSVCVRTLYTVFPQIKAFGCCHEVFGTQKLLAAMLKDQKGIENATRQEIDISVTGINHFTWITKASCRGMDLFPLYRNFAKKHYETGFCENTDSNWMNDSFACAHRVKFDLFLRHGLIAAAGDRHLAEFLPSWYYLKDPETVRQWMFGLTTVDYRIQDLHKRLARSKRLLSGEEQFELKPSGEEGILLIKALLGLKDKISNVNLPNRGQVANLPLGTVVETNARFSRDSIAPVFSGSLPNDVLGLVMRHAVNQAGTVEAGLRKDRDFAFRVFQNDPRIALSVNDARQLFDLMVENTQKYLNWD
ncbi:MAG: alpha-glucosidase/alpha-galactosidase [Oscillospiraceae bacterium]|jgi:alpha-galactosidase|nr:alpha-glucosidase/alpha-galactosidase [Oscillospiraceae bacterium]MCI2035139.1 alpha-glucosidase/alpha-galactosidase [Oscillospiraceae bacterium]